MPEAPRVALDRYRSKTLATWLALLLGGFGLHRVYLFGTRDLWAWMHPLPMAAGLYGLERARELGQDDRLAWLLLPIGGLMLAQAALCAIVYGLTPDARWDARHNAGRAAHRTAWGPVLGAVAGLAIGATALLSTIAYTGQRYFELQVEAAR